MEGEYVRLRSALIVTAVLLAVGFAALGQTATATATSKPSDLVLSNDSIRMRFHRPGPGKFGIFPQGYTGYTIDLKVGTGWVGMARTPYFTAYSYRSGWGRDWLAYVIPASGESHVSKDESSAVFKDIKRDFDGVRWDFTFEFAAKARANWIDVTYSAKNNHLLGLYVPNILKYAAENSLRAHTPAIIEAGQTVSISCRIFAGPAQHATDAVDLYLKIEGGP
jgi:hypothetical protein